MNEPFVPWGTLFGLLFMTMGPVHAVAVFASYGEDDKDPNVRALAGRSLGLLAAAFVAAVLFGDQILASWGVGLPALIGAAGMILIVLSLHATLKPSHAEKPRLLIADARAAEVVFPGLFPPIAIALLIIFAAAAPGLTSKVIILGLGVVILALNWVAMRYSKSIFATIGLAPFQILGAIFAVLQTALGIEFIIDAHRLL